MTSPTVPPAGWFDRALTELRPACQAINSAALDDLVAELLAARHIVTYGVGREGLMMRALCMRLVHAGLDAHVAGDMSTPPIGHQDLLIVSAGPGEFSTVLALEHVAQDAGARIALLTANARGRAAQLADVVLHIPARTMADDRETPGVLPMGSAFEAIEFLLSDLLSTQVRDARGEDVERMRSRHTNLE